MFSPIPLSQYTISVILIWLFHVSGILGIIYGDAQWFIEATPINLGVSFVLLLGQGYKERRFLGVVLICFFVGMLTEWLGVNKGLIFGQYQYGEMLGPKFMGVPWLIGANWVIVVTCTGMIARELFENVWVRSLVATGLMLFLDVLIEPIAPTLDFWQFDQGLAPLQNYIGWFFVALPLQFVFHFSKVHLGGWFFHHLYLLQVLFFTILLLRLNSLPNF
ncbi:MAG: carotenoid biosynthesis protein [Flavobacteriaceae bacterium]